MLCSHCSETVKPVVAVDIDGTLGDYHGHFMEFAMDYLGIGDWSKDHYRASRYSGATTHGAWFTRLFGVDMTTFRDIKLAFRQGGMKRTMPVMYDAGPFLMGLRAAGAEVWLATARPYNRLDSVDPDTRAWLDRNQLFFDYLLYDDDKYTVLAERVDKTRVVAVLDDLPEQIDAATAVFGSSVPILMRTPYNQDAEYRAPNEVNSLVVVQPFIEQRIQDWENAHA